LAHTGLNYASENATPLTLSPIAVPFNPCFHRRFELLHREVGRDPTSGSIKTDRPDGRASPWEGADLQRPSVSLAPASPLSRPLEEFGGLSLQDGSQLADDLQANVGHDPLDPAQVGPVYPRVMGQLLLGQLPVMTKPTQVRRKKLA